MNRRLPALLAAAVVGAGILLSGAPAANAGTVPSTAVAASGRVMCLVIDGQPQAVCLDYPGVLNIVSDLLP